MAKENKSKLIEEELKIPKTEKVCEQYFVGEVLKYIKTYDIPLRSVYWLYTVTDGIAIKTKHKAETPDLLNKWIEE